MAKTNWIVARSRGAIRASGVVERIDDQGAVVQSSSIEIRSRVDGAYREEVSGEDRTSSLLVLGDSGSISNGISSTMLPPHVALAMQPAYFPFFADLSIPDDPDVSVRHREAEPLVEARRRASVKTIWLGSTKLVAVVRRFRRTDRRGGSGHREDRIRIDSGRRQAGQRDHACEQLQCACAAGYTVGDHGCGYTDEPFVQLPSRRGGYTGWTG